MNAKTQREEMRKCWPVMWNHIGHSRDSNLSRRCFCSVPPTKWGWRRWRRWRIWVIMQRICRVTQRGSRWRWWRICTWGWYGLKLPTPLIGRRSSCIVQSRWRRGEEKEDVQTKQDDDVMHGRKESGICFERKSKNQRRK
jgi:hypothetical protein